MMKVALCIMCKDEQKYLQENIAHHVLLGVDTIIVYDNNSKIPIKKMKWFKENPHVHVVDWPDKKRLSHIRAFRHCLKHFKQFDWIGFIDTDEFVVIKTKENIKQFLGHYKEYGGLGIQWKCFGSSGHKTKQESVIESFTQASGTMDDKHVKCFVQTKYCLGPRGNPHQFSYVKGRPCVNELGKNIPGPFNQPISRKRIQLNHYVTRSREDFEEKRKRGGGNTQDNNKLTEAFWDRFNKNDKECLAILEMRKKLLNNK